MRAHHARSLAEYIMRGRKQAIIVAFIFAWIPLLGWMADVITCFVTLRKGPKEGLAILPWSVLPNIVYASLSSSNMVMITVAYSLIGTSVASYFLAILLRETNSWSIVVEIAGLLGILTIIIVHLVNPNIALHWVNDLNNYIKAGGGDVNQLNSPDTQDALKFVASILMGLQIMGLLIGDFFNLFLARFMQSQLYNPGAAQEEMRTIRLSITTVIISVVITGLASFGKISFAVDSMPIVILIFVIAGSSLVHYFLAKNKAHLLWYVVYYCALFFILPFIVGLATLDSWRNFRQRYGQIA